MVIIITTHTTAYWTGGGAGESLPCQDGTHTEYFLEFRIMDTYLFQ